MNTSTQAQSNPSTNISQLQSGMKNNFVFRGRQLCCSYQQAVKFLEHLQVLPMFRVKYHVDQELSRLHVQAEAAMITIQKI